MNQRATARKSEHEALDILGWAFTNPPTQEAYRRSTGEDVAQVLIRYRQWLEENIIGSDRSL